MSLWAFYKPHHRNKVRAYISGPMSGIENDNHEAFDLEAERLRGKGWTVCSPAETSDWLGHDLTHEEYLRFDFERVLEADAVFVLDGWENSLGALAEIHVALRLGIPVVARSHRITYEELVAAMKDRG